MVRETGVRDELELPYQCLILLSVLSLGPCLPVAAPYNLTAHLILAPQLLINSLHKLYRTVRISEQT